MTVRTRLPKEVIGYTAVKCPLSSFSAIVRFTSHSKDQGKTSSSSNPQSPLNTSNKPEDSNPLSQDGAKLDKQQPLDATKDTSHKQGEESASHGQLSPSSEDVGTTAKKPGVPSLFPRHLRRLIVRRSDIFTKNRTTSTSLDSPPNLQQLVGTYKRTPLSQSEIRDSYGQLILKPAPVPSKSSLRYLQLHHHQNMEKFTSSPTESNRGSGRFGDKPDEFSVASNHVLTASLPLLNASVMLDPAKYVKTMDITMGRSGTEAARRILRGRKEWYTTVRKHAERGLDPQTIPLWPNKFSYPMQRMIRRASYRLTGHGVPRELLQDHIDYAGFLLSQNQATSLMLASRESIRVRRPDGSHHNVPVPEDCHSLDLYMAVMERIARTLSIVLQPDSNSPFDRPLQHPSAFAATHNENDLTHEFHGRTSPQNHAVPSNNNHSSPHHRVHPPMWHVEFTRGWVVAEPTVNHLEPIVEWVWPRQVCIRLRGRPKTNPRMAVALAYDTTFPSIGK